MVIFGFLTGKVLPGMGQEFIGQVEYPHPFLAQLAYF
jgi:hypothetical protein